MQSIYRKIIKVLNVNQKRNLIFIFFLILIGVFLEILGIGMIIPLMNVIINNDLKKKISQAKQWKKVKTGFNYSSDTNKLWLSNSDIHDLISEDNAKKNL